MYLIIIAIFILPWILIWSAYQDTRTCINQKEPTPYCQIVIDHMKDKAQEQKNDH